MSKWYCIIQSRNSEYDGWKQIIKDLIIADTKKEAREIVEKEYMTLLPMRIQNKDITKESLLLSLYEIEENHFTEKFFEYNDCKVCGSKFRPIDKFNIFGYFGSNEVCSDECNITLRNEQQIQQSSFEETSPVIYKITQISSGKVYIGKTIRSFTLRWWEHIKSCSGSKFHIEMDSSDITDWQFQVIEVLPKNSKNEFILERETYWINHFDSIKNGFNSVISINNPTLSNA